MDNYFRKSIRQLALIDLFFSSTCIVARVIGFILLYTLAPTKVDISAPILAALVTIAAIAIITLAVTIRKYVNYTDAELVYVTRKLQYWFYLNLFIIGLYVLGLTECIIFHPDKTTIVFIVVCLFYNSWIVLSVKSYMRELESPEEPDHFP